MRKITALFTSLATIFFFTANSFAQTIDLSVKTNQSPAALYDVKSTSQGLQDKIEISVDTYKGYVIKRFDRPDRIVVDIPNTVTSRKQQNISVKSKMVKSVRYAQFGKSTSRIVVDTVGKPQYQVEEKDKKLVLYIVSPITKGITYYNDGSNANLILSGARLIQGKSLVKKLFTEKYESSGKKYTISFPSSLMKVDNKTVKIDDSYIKTIEILNDKKAKTTSISFFAKDRFSYEATARDDVKGTGIVIRNPAMSDRGLENRSAEGEIDNGSIEPGTAEELPAAGSDSNVNGSTDTSNTQSNSTYGPLLDIKFNLLDSEANEIDIPLSNYTNYNIMRITGPDRIVIDIPNTSVSADQQTISVGSTLIKSIRYAQYENNTARIVIDTVGQLQYKVEERTGLLALIVEKPTYRNITYDNSGDRVHFILNKATLTEGGAYLKNLYSESFDETGLKYTITFNSTQADIGSGTININNSLLNSVDIVKDDLSGLTSMTFNAKEKVVYNIITRDLTNDTAITVLKPFSNEDKLVVIDAGHGGIEPGAGYGDLLEKNLNLDISLRLNALLKAKGIKTYMIREDDRYVGLYERAYIANKLNASLFMCVHNNANDYYSKGTETLYYPGDSGFGEKFAQSLQDSLINALGTVNRKIVPRPGLVVLKATTMPAALAEIAFLDNKDDRAKLLDDNFRQKAAQALCDGIIKTLNEIEG